MSKLKLLAVIANFGTKNDVHLRRLLREYRSLPFDVHVIALTNVAKAFDDGTEVVVRQAVGHPWSFPFAHKAILAANSEEYDLFIYSEDDTLITHRNITGFLNATEVLARDEIAGFLRVEVGLDGQRSVSTVNSHFHWDPTSVVRRGRYTFAYFSNEHAASYVLTREHLKRAIASGGFLVEPHQSKYDLLVTAATDPYTQCGLRKLICISHIDDFLIAHLSNKYVTHLGISCEAFKRQVQALREIDDGARPATTLLRTETRLPHLRWSKNFYKPAPEAVTAALPGDLRTVLSYGCGIGTLERELKARGVNVTAVALDSVIGACQEAEGLEVIYGDESRAFRALCNRRFDAVLALDLLHLAPRPSATLASLARLLRREGRLVATTPNMGWLRTAWKRWKGNPAIPNLDDYESSGVHLASYRALQTWFTEAGLGIEKIIPVIPKPATARYRIARRLLPRLSAEEFVVLGRRGQGIADV